ncbi:hypothetical protein GH714_043235 [Hevea brasiliensis]|uniref:SAM domain-containing protein n=1 Tax=Hevea brasiliensis TaxID=3981 RepID=A0A6A6K403_HEVBR|nr:hypothetical protein GH714_043235 [Hevea brasiliensis]
MEKAEGNAILIKEEGRVRSELEKRPNVRLGEIGDVPVAFACGFSQKTKENLGHKNYENDVLNPNETAQKFSNGNSKECSVKEFLRFNSDECNDYYPANGLKDFSDHETLATSKKACEFDTYEHDTRQHDNFNELWQEDTCNEVNNVSPVSNHMWDGMMSRGGDVNTVTRWLEEQGFGKYAGVFEMHEVDEEALPLLNLEDLKEIGVFAVGSRRKLYTAIQQLRKRSHFCLLIYSNKDVVVVLLPILLLLCVSPTVMTYWLVIIN